ncbi:hypothetical protein [Rariglobus hedericola]|uniref:Nuclease n=1 Tax=Rariglobus hedericola TaxID=2597822 RepID=A0A556QL60_9BACT|nr:hypothetical protein [Rariglobus hedericola]TSJ77385.1 hypothetical protein FPL22_14945 [Rariglobus hedericola]
MLFRRLALFLAAAASLHAWDYEGHRTVNQLALAGLPEEFPAFVKTPAAAERIAFLAGEPDRWRSTNELPLKHVNGPDHFLDFEYLDDAGLPVATLSEFRYVYTAQFAAAHAAHPEKFPAVDPDKNKDHTRELIGYLPWAIIENYAKLKSAFSYLRAFEENGTPDEIANAQANALYIMGVMGHYVGDGSQPLHTTKHHNGWVGENPHNYTRSSSIHAWIDGGYIALGGLSTADLVARARPAHDLAIRPEGSPPATRNLIFEQTLAYLLTQHALVEPLYQLDQTGALKPGSADGGKAGREFIGEQLLRGGEMLSSLWLTAWKQAAPDVYLRAQLVKRKAAATATAAPATAQ